MENTLEDALFETAILEDAAASFAAASEPDIPQIESPAPGHLMLMWGIAGEDEERQLRAEVRELNGADEEAMARLKEGSPSYYTDLVDLVLKRAVESVGDTAVNIVNSALVLGDLLVADRELLFKEIILATFGTEREYENIDCPTCQAPNDITVDVEGLIEVKPLEGEPVTKVVLRDKTVVTLHYPLGKDQKFVYDTNEELSPAGYNTRMIARCIDTVDGGPLRETMATSYALDLGMADRRKIVTALAGGPSVKFKEVEVPCTECGEAIPFAFGWADLLWV
jgi:hypothetical protein